MKSDFSSTQNAHELKILIYEEHRERRISEATVQNPFYKYSKRNSRDI